MEYVEGGDVDVTMKYSKGKTRVESGDFILYHMMDNQHSLLKEDTFTDKQPEPKEAESNNFSIDNFPKDEVVSAYSHLHLSPHNTAKVEKNYLQNISNELSETIKKYKPDIKESELNKTISDFMKDYVDKRRDMVWNAAKYAFSSAVAGRNNFNKKQADKRGDALDRGEEKFSNWLTNKIDTIESITGVSDAKREEKAKKASTQEGKQKSKKVSWALAWQKLSAGDNVKLWSGNEVTIAKKSKYSFETKSGTKYGIKEILGISSKEYESILSEYESSKT
jgi:hypothetical protein